MDFGLLSDNVSIVVTDQQGIQVADIDYTKTATIIISGGSRVSYDVTYAEGS